MVNGRSSLKLACMNHAGAVKGGVDDYTAKFADVEKEEFSSVPSQQSTSLSQLSGSADFPTSLHTISVHKLVLLIGLSLMLSGGLELMRLHRQTSR